MFESASVDILHLFVFVIPGFITVWSFRYFTDSKKSADFEYFALSIVWGLLILVLNEAISSQEAFNLLINNQYAAALGSGLIGLFVGFIGSWIVKRTLFKLLINWLKNSL
jgi:hypothetical protein